MFKIFVNDLVQVIKHISLFAYLDDRQIFYADKESAKIEETINNDVARVDIWYEENGMRTNPAKYQAVVMGKAQTTPQFYHEHTGIPITEKVVVRESNRYRQNTFTP